MENLIKQIIKDLGENPKREGLVKTPSRYAAALRHLTSGYKINAEEVIKKAIFNENYNEMVIVKDIEFYSLCEHHMLPFFGKAHIAYTPKGKIVGLSKIPRIVNIFSRRLQVQERLTQDVSNCLMKTLKPHGVGVVIEAYHMCMMMRGVEKQRSSTLTSSMLGTFREDARTRKEFLNLVSKPFSI